MKIRRIDQILQYSNISTIIVLMLSYLFLFSGAVKAETITQQIPMIELETEIILQPSQQEETEVIQVILENDEEKKQIEEAIELEIEQKNEEISDPIEQIEPLKQIEQKSKDRQLIAKEYQGFETSGIISIKKIGVNYPIVSKANYRAMELAPCILYSTGELNKSGNTLIIGHNYQNGTLFSDNKKLSRGDSIEITSLDGMTQNYIIYEKYMTTPEDADYMKRKIGNKPEISISTCSDDETQRLILLARAQ